MRWGYFPLRARGKRSVFPEWYLTLQFIDFVGKATHLLDGASNRGPKHKSLKKKGRSSKKWQRAILL